LAYWNYKPITIEADVMSEPEIIRSPETNWAAFLKQEIRDYNASMGLAHGLQKDAIQNGWGARVSDHNWTFEFKLKRMTHDKLLLTMTDHGTTGLTGTTCYFESRKKQPGQEVPKIPDHERLARFESMFYSGGTGVGLFGRGKLLFNAVSNQKLIYYDSKTIDGEYRLNYRKIDDVEGYTSRKRVLEGESAQTMVAEWTNGVLKPLTTTGTRIIVVDPIQEVVDSIHDGSFLRAIEETWWEIIQKYSVKISVIDEEDKIFLAQIPKEYSTLPKTSGDEWRVYYKPNVEVKIGDGVYRIKHLHLLLAPPTCNLRPELQEVNVHRRGMKIGSLQLEIPEEISNRFFGYVQLNPDFEDLISEAETTTHYGFTSMRKSPIRELRNSVRADFELFMQQLGFGPSSQEKNEKAKRILDKAKADLDKILRDMGIPSLSSGRSIKSDFSISVTNLNFPNNSNCVQIGAAITGFKYKITNRSGNPKKIFLEIVTHESSVGVIETLLPRKEVRIRETFETEPLSLTIKAGLYPRGKKISCTASVTDEKQINLCEKSFSIYVDLTPPPIEELASIVLSSADWPREKSRRVDFGQKIRNLLYETENLTPLLMKARLKVGTIWAEELERIEDVFELDMMLAPYETKSFVVPEVQLTREKYSEIDKGKMILRCHAVALESTLLWENRRKLDVNDVIFYLNKDPGYGFFEDPDYTSDGPAKPRSIVKPMEGQRWKMWINNTHPAYEAVSDDDVLVEEYVFEEMARQTVFVLLQRGDANVIRKLINLAATKNPEEMDPSDVLRLIAYPITDQILSSYYIGRR
jgi:hypothetical protein